MARNIQLSVFKENIELAWKQLQHKNDFCDLTLACDDDQILVHKAVISANSPVFQNILKLHLNQTSFIFIKDVEGKDLKNILNFIYQGEITLPEEDLKNFTRLADDFQIKGLYGVLPPVLSNTNPFVKRKKLIKEKKKVVSPVTPLQLGNLSHAEYLARKLNKKFAKQNVVSNEICSDKEDENIIDNEINEERSDEDPLEENVQEEESENNYQDRALVKEEKKIFCDKCDKSFFSDMGLNSHLTTIHEGIKYPCDYCDYRASIKNHLKKHIAAIHEGIKYPCDQCPYQATQKESLKRHVKTQHINK